MIRHKSILILFIMMACLCGLTAKSDNNNGNQGLPIPDAIQEIMNNPPGRSQRARGPKW
jgi:hypothetical protein